MNRWPSGLTLASRSAALVVGALNSSFGVRARTVEFGDVYRHPLPGSILPVRRQIAPPVAASCDTCHGSLGPRHAKTRRTGGRRSRSSDRFDG
jgi:hypothetical protein